MRHSRHNLPPGYVIHIWQAMLCNLLKTQGQKHDLHTAPSQMYFHVWISDKGTKNESCYK